MSIDRGILLPKESTTDSLKSICISVNFLEKWFKLLESNCGWIWLDY